MTDRSTRVVVVNGFDNPATITLIHRSGSEGADEVKTWNNVPFSKDGGDPLIVHYKTGVLSPNDFWHVKIVVSDGPNRGTWENNGLKECYLTEDDQQMDLRFSVSPNGGFKLDMISSSCTTGLSRTG